MLSQRNLASNSATLAELWGFTAGDVLLHALPIFHTHGLFVATNCSIANGSPMVFLDRFDADEVLRGAAAVHGDDGCAHLLHTVARASRLRTGGVCRDASVHQRLGTVAGIGASTSSPLAPVMRSSSGTA